MENVLGNLLQAPAASELQMIKMSSAESVFSRKQGGSRRATLAARS